MDYFASNLKLLRSSFGETQESLAEALHVGNSTISQYESGTRKPNDDEILKVLLSAMGLQ
ncbi:MAG: helix-turn-helix domain-containing protein [Streptococcus sp.]